MRYLSVLFALLVFGASQLPAQGGMKIFKHSLTKAQIEAGVKVGCPKTLWNVSCKMFAAQLHEVDSVYAPTADRVPDLPAYIHSLDEGLCGEGTATFAVALSYDAVKFSEKRSFRPAERCLKNPRTGENVMSEDCGNAAMNVFMTTRPVSYGVETMRQSIKDTQFIHVDVAVTLKDTLQIKPGIQGPSPAAALPVSVPVSDKPSRYVEKKGMPKWLKTTLKVGEYVGIVAVATGVTVCISNNCLSPRVDVNQTVTVNGTTTTTTTTTGHPVIPTNSRGQPTAGLFRLVIGGHVVLP